MSGISDRQANRFATAATVLLVSAVFTGVTLCTNRVNKVKNGDGSATKFDSTLKSIEDAFAIIGAAGNPGVSPYNKDPVKQDSIERYHLFGQPYYIPTPEEVNKMADSTKNPLTYHGVEVDSLKIFSNAKLLGMDNYEIDYKIVSPGSSSKNIYHTKFLLFELNNSKTVSLIGSAAPFYIGQRYDIQYHPFKKDVEIDGQDILKMLVNTNHDYKADIGSVLEKHDGVLINYDLSKRK